MTYSGDNWWCPWTAPNQPGGSRQLCDSTCISISHYNWPELKLKYFYQTKDTSNCLERVKKISHFNLFSAFHLYYDRTLLRGLTQTHFLMSFYQVIFGCQNDSEVFFARAAVRKKMGFCRKHCQRHNGPKGWVLLTKVSSLGHITSSYTNLDQTSSETRPSTNFKISIEHQHFDKTS